ncbi:MAG: hypothetical protein C4519_11820 [Desulfobacteraceae bacterium]|nr:MAG: hypothetical protein C4519_11820 [Desulfobacteraceae bacterium]
MIRQIPMTSLDLLYKTGRVQPAKPGFETYSENVAENEDEENWYVCRNCQQRLTRPSHRINVQGSHIHTFANPSGIVFEIACFNSARGYSFMGPASAEFAWFSGFAWRIIICSSCLNHLGWYFSSMGSGSFFAFITDKIQIQSLPKA